jgi:hypothetical protein
MFEKRGAFKKTRGVITNNFGFVVSKKIFISIYMVSIFSVGF